MSIQVQQQSTPAEVLVADHQSNDHTIQELAGLKGTATLAIHISSQLDLGPADALNKAFKRSSGSIIGWLNADDEYLPGAFQAVVDHFNAHPDHLLVYGQGQLIDEAGQVLGLYPTLQPTEPIDRFQRGCFISQPTVFMRRELMEAIGPFNIEYRSAFDLEYWLRVFLRYPDRIGFIDQVLASTRLHENTITSRQRSRGALEAMRALHTHLGYAEDNWARSYLNELKAQSLSPEDYTSQVQQFLVQAASYLSEKKITVLQAEFQPPTVSTSTLNNQAGPLPWLGKLIHAARVDLRQKMDLTTAEGYWSYCAWLLRSAINANKALCLDREFLDFCANTCWPGTQLSLVESVIYQASPVFNQQYPLPASQSAFKAWVESNIHLPVLAAYKPLWNAVQQRGNFNQSAKSLWPHNAVQSRQRPYGINVIGYVQTQSGIGEDARTTFDSLRSKGFECCLIDFKPGDPLKQGVHTHDAHLVQSGPYSINVICLPATELVRYAVTEGLPQMQGRYNIGYWPWELNGWPKAWVPIDELVDEVWVASRFIRDSIAPSVRKPINIVPLHVELGPVSPLTRADFGLPGNAKLFCFAFDLNSSIHRKNPQDCVRIFLQSFPREAGWTKEQVGLVIKTHKPIAESAEWAQLKALAEQDDRIHIFEQSFFKPDLLALYNVCDCFLSLHRAEGYGRNIAEAIQLGLEVVTTGYSGNLDFCHPPQCTLVDFELIPVEPHQYPDGEGFQWAGHLKLPKLDAVRRRFPATSTG